MTSWYDEQKASAEGLGVALDAVNEAYELQKKAAYESAITTARSSYIESLQEEQTILEDALSTAKDNYINGLNDEIDALNETAAEAEKTVESFENLLETIKGCVEKGIKPDFWVKTLHRNQYWSARTNEEYNDNCWCLKPEETIAFMNEREEPWIAFKVLAAGAIEPAEGIRYAFESGADFVCLGMYDFQVVEDTNIAWDIFEKGFDRNRPWRA